MNCSNRSYCTTSQLCRGEFTESFRLQPVGCYKDRQNNRALPHYYHTLRGKIQWKKPRRGLDLVVNECAKNAYEKGYDYFGVQNHGECYGEGTNYAKYGDSDNCDMYDVGAGHAVGKKLTNFVYRLIKTIT